MSQDDKAVVAGQKQYDQPAGYVDKFDLEQLDSLGMYATLWRADMVGADDQPRIALYERPDSELEDLRVNISVLEQGEAHALQLARDAEAKSKDLENRLAVLQASVKSFLRIHGMSCDNSTARNRAVVDLMESLNGSNMLTLEQHSHIASAKALRAHAGNDWLGCDPHHRGVGAAIEFLEKLAEKAGCQAVVQQDVALSALGAGSN